MNHPLLQFVWRGEIVSLPAVPPSRTLLALLREDLAHSATKEGCNQGDCGACTVVLAELRDGQLRYQAVNSCIRLAHSIHGMALWTAADLAAADGTPHPVQQALLQNHASQCGFCTPGFAMSLFGLYQNHVVKGQAVTRALAQQAVSGNLCRCTGYRPILAAAQQLASLPRVRQDETVLLSLLEHIADTDQGLEADLTYKTPLNLAQLLTLRAAYPQAQIVAGGTDVGLWINQQHPPLAQMLDVSRVAELKLIDEQEGHCVIGAAVSLTDAFAALQARRSQLHSFFSRFAGLPVRNAGTLGGNIVNGSPIGDSMPLLIALRASVVLMSGRGRRELALADFYTGYRKNGLAADEVLAYVRVPHPQADEFMRVYKVSKRLEDDISAVCLALNLQVQGGRVSQASIGVGGVATTPVRAVQTERALLGQPWSLATVSAAVNTLRNEFAPISDVRASAAYRVEVLGNLLQRFWLESQGAPDASLAAFSLPDADSPGAAAAPAAPSVSGQSHPHDSAAAHIAGAAPYIDDLPELRGTLHAAPILSRVAHGKLLGVNRQPALDLPGVHAVLLAADLPGHKMLAAFAGDEPVFAIDTVQHVGQVIGLVVADSHALARQAARLVPVDIEPLPAVLDVRQALAAQSFVLPPVTVRRGDAEQALARAAHRLDGRLEVGGQEHFYLEGQVAYALPQEQRQWLIYSSTQHPGQVQHWVAQALGLEQHAVRVECRRIGGGFGGKETQAGHLAVWAAVAAHTLQCPVKLRLDRDDDFLITGKRHPFSYDYRVGFDDSGRLCGLALQMLAHCGFSADLSGPVADRALFHADNAYFLQDVAITSYRCKLNTQSHTAFRGFGGPQGMIVIESILSDIARHLGLDPLAVRLRNLYSDEPVLASDDVSAAKPSQRRNTTHYGMLVEGNLLRPLLSQLEHSADYQSRREAISLWNSKSAVLRRGLAITPVKFGISFTATLFNQAGALVHVYQDGSVQVNHGGVEMGQGLHTKVAQLVADELGLPLACVQSTASDTSKVPNASATAASAGTDLNGRAAQLAARQVRDRLAALLARLDGVGAAAVQFAAGSVSTPKATRAFIEVVALAYAHRIQLWSDGFYRTPKIHYDKATLSGRPFYYFAYGAACTEVVIDTLTGESRVLKVDILHDVGRSINPALDIGQIEGGFVQGMGWLTTEELVWNEHGALTSHAPSTYKIPTAGDVPQHFKIDLWPAPNPEDNVFGSKAVGEPPLMLAISVFEALRDAIAQTRGDGLPVQLSAPATAENVLRALQPSKSE